VGLSTRQTVMVLYSCSVYFGAAAIAFSRFGSLSSYFIPVIFALFLLGLKRLEGLSSFLSASGTGGSPFRGPGRDNRRKKAPFR